MAIEPDPRTAADDNEDATDQGATDEGVSAEDPAEGANDESAPGPGSPQG